MLVWPHQVGPEWVEYFSTDQRRGEQQVIEFFNLDINARASINFHNIWKRYPRQLRFIAESTIINGYFKTVFSPKIIAVVYKSFIDLQFVL